MEPNTLLDDATQDAGLASHEPARVRMYHSFDVLAPCYDDLFEQAAQQSFFLTRRWFESLAANILDSGKRLCLIGVETATPVPSASALIVAYEQNCHWIAGGTRRLSSLSNYYSMVFQPLMADTAQAWVLPLLIRTLCAQEPRYSIFRFQPLDKTSSLYEELQKALQDAGLVVQPYFQWGNRYECVAGLSSTDYFSNRPSALRNTVGRKSEKLLRGGARVEIITDAKEVARGIADYERVYAKSWKRTESYPVIMRDVMRDCAVNDSLRLGFLHLDDEPVAAQIWIVWAGKATLYKLAHDRRYDSLSPGTVLTMRMVERVIDTDGVAEIDFGAGEDPYKRHWASNRRERWGLLAFDPGTLCGGLSALRHIGGKKMKNALKHHLHQFRIATRFTS